MLPGTELTAVGTPTLIGTKASATEGELGMSPGTGTCVVITKETTGESTPAAKGTCGLK